MKIPQILAGTLACVLVTMASATTYYVSASGGDDSKDGQSQATAWKTIAKVNAASLAPGDQVLFKRGDTWQESLVPAGSGTSGSAIAFDAYGTGEAPTITGALNLPSASWTPANCWSAVRPPTTAR